MSQKALYNIRNRKARKRAQGIIHDTTFEFEPLTEREIAELQADARLTMRLSESLRRFKVEICRGKLSRPQIAFALRRAVYERDGNHCVQCSSPLNLTLHHLKPVSRKGQTAYDNLQTLCIDCHRMHHVRGEKR
jgi:hypothetical protein